MNKKGVTRPILIIGMIAIAVIVIILGVQVFTPLFKTTPQYLAFEQKLSVETLLAAPETAQQVITHDAMFFAGTGHISRTKTCAKKTPETAISLTSNSECFDLVYESENKLIVGEITINKKITVVKEYVEETGKTTLTGS